MQGSQDNHIAVAMSGGVDSSVAALLLQREGYEVTGVFMRNWDDTDSACTMRDDFFDALQVCERLGIELLPLDLSKTYRGRVFAHFLAESCAGRTPNPDILCNSEIKFGAFADAVTRLTGVTSFATGHYARLVSGQLWRGTDANKDQSYFLCRVSATQLSRARFPIGALDKPSVRAIAREAGLVTAEKRDSTGICFIGKRHFRAFLEQHLPPNPGPMLSTDGTLLGEHKGLGFYTIGQRQGLGIGGRADCEHRPWYVAAKDHAANVLLLVQDEHHPLLYSTALHTLPAHWVGTAPDDTFACTAKIRYRQPDQPCRVSPHSDGSLSIRFDVPQRAVTPGQWAVLYCGERCLGGAAIDAIAPKDTDTTTQTTAALNDAHAGMPVTDVPASAAPGTAN